MPIMEEMWRKQLTMHMLDIKEWIINLMHMEEA
jgi:hypothetical protein